MLSFSITIITDRPLYTTAYGPCLEQTTTHHICTIPASFLQSYEDSFLSRSFPNFMSCL